MGDQPHFSAPDPRWKSTAPEQGHPMCIKEEETPVEISTESLAPRGIKRNAGDGEDEGPTSFKEEEFQIEIDTSGFTNVNPPGAAPAPSSIHSQKPTSANRNILQAGFEVKQEAADPYGRDAGQYKEEEMPLEIGHDGSYNQYPAQRASRNSAQGDQDGNLSKVQVKEEKVSSQFSLGFRTENRNSPLNTIDPLEGRSMDNQHSAERYPSLNTGVVRERDWVKESRFQEDDDEMPDEEYSYSIDSESDDRFSEESEETDDSEDLSPSPPTPMDEKTERFLAMLQEQVCPSHLPIPPCFQNDPIRSDDEPEEPEVKEENLVGHTDWCECGKCQLMPANSDCLCCRKVENVEEYLLGGLTCVTLSEEFHNRCLNEKVLRYLLEYDRSTTRRDYVEDKYRCFRRAAYRSYTRMIHGFRKKRALVPIPSCVVSIIRERFPDPKPYTHCSLDYPASYVAMSVAERG